MSDPEGTSAGMRVLVAAPTRRDGEVTAELFRRHGLDCLVCHELQAAVDAVSEGVGAIVLTDAALPDPAMPAMVEALRCQPAWSDIATLMLTRDRSHSPAALHTFAAVGNVVLLDRPTSTRALVSAVQSALRARRKQYQIRDQLVAQRGAEEALVAADRRKDAFLATLAHELRNPLAAIKIAVDLMGRHPGDAGRAERMVQMMGRQCRLLVRLIDDLMDVSRISTGKVALARDRLDLRAVVQAAIEGPTVFDPDRHALSLDLPRLPVPVVGDALRLAQVVGNLVNNATKYTPQGGRIDLRLERDGHAAVLQVADTGVGIPDDMLEQVFQMFTQVDRTLDRAQGGLGIGLSLVRQLVALHGGSVTAASDGVGHGSTFTVRLPIDADATGATFDDPPPKVSPASRRLHILVVDDNPDVADGLASLLDADGHAVRTVYSGADALAAAADTRPDIVFCDIGMPGMTGHDVAQRLRADPSQQGVLLVAVTGWGNAEDKRLCDAAGFDYHFTKPVSLEDVRGVLGRF